MAGRARTKRPEPLDAGSFSVIQCACPGAKSGGCDVVKTRIRFAFSVILTVGIGLLLCYSAFGSTSISKQALSLTYTDEADGYTMPYRLFLPEDYGGDRSFPVLLFLHGAGERGQDNVSQLTVGIQRMFKAREDLLKETIVICPQCPEGEQWVDRDWSLGNYSTDSVEESRALRAALSILSLVESDYSCDENRVYAVGLSMGGFGVWDLLARHGERFAAGVPICGGGDPGKAEVLCEIPIWCFHGANDPIVPCEGTREMVESISQYGKERIIFTLVEDGEHDIWNRVLSNPELIEWLYDQNLALRAVPAETENRGGEWFLPAGIAALSLLAVTGAVLLATRARKRSRD